MPATDISVCSNALALLGQDPINDLEDDIGTATGVTCAQVYPDFKRSLLSMHPWHFTKSRAKLTKLAAAPVSEWDSSFLLPSPRLVAPTAVFKSAADDIPFKLFEIVGDTLECDQDEIWIEYQVERSEAFWPPYFQQFVTVALAAEIAMAVTEQRTMADSLHRKAWGLPSEGERGGWFRRASQAEARRSPSKSLLQDGGPLIAARLG